MFPSFCHICLHLIPSNRFVNLRPLVRQTSSPLIFNTSLRFLLHLLITLGFLPTRQKSWETADVLYPDSRWTCLPPYSVFESDNMSSTSGPLKRKVVIMGSTSVGKTSLTQQYVAPPTYTASYYPTIEDTSHKIVKYKGADYDIEIVDSAGLEEYSLFPGKYAVGVHGYMLVYSIASRQSFDMVPTIYDKILDYAGLESVPLVIVGQKTDLRDERSVTKEEGEALAKKLRAGFIESSAKDNANVSGAFEVLLEEMQKVYNPQPEKKKSSWWPW